MVSTRLLARNISIKFRPLLKERTFLGKKNNGWPNDGSATMQLKAQKFPFHNRKPKKPIKVSTWLPFAQFSKRVTFIPPSPWRKLCLLNRFVPLQNCLWNNFIKPLYNNSPSIVSAFQHTQPLTPELLCAILPSQERKALGLTINTAAPIAAQTSTTVIEDSMPQKIKKRKGRGIGAYNIT